MPMLVSLELVKEIHRIEYDTDDVSLTMMTEAASAAVINHLKDQATELIEFDSAGDVSEGFDVPYVIQMATAILVGYWYRSPDADEEMAFAQGQLPGPVAMLLHPLRDPALA